MKQEPEKVIIEKTLHPCLKFGNIEFLHEHRGQRIVFSAWENNKEINNKKVSFHRDTILYHENFYETYKNVFYELMEVTP